MAIQQTKKQSDLEKRLRLLRQQVYGKDTKSLRTTQNASSSENQTIRNSDRLAYKYGDSPTSSPSSQSDISYLRYDLVKILILSTLAIGIQLILFILTKNHILNLNFF